MTTLEHRASVRNYYGPNVPTTSSLYRPHSTAPPPHWFPTEPGPSSALTPRLEPLNHHPTNSTRLWCQTQFCLLTVGLSLLVTLNAALLLWILSYLNFDNFTIESNPMHHLHSKSAHSKVLSSNRLAIHGSLQVNNGHLEANSIASPNGEQLRIMSQSNVMFGPHDLATYEAEMGAVGKLPWLQMSPTKLLAHSCNLVVKSAVNENLLMLLQSSTDDLSGRSVVIGVDSIQIKGSKGLLLNSSIQVPNVQSAQELFLYSPNQRILVRGPKQLDIALHQNDDISSTGNTSIRMTSAAQIKLESTRHKIFLNTSSIHFSSLLLTVHPSKHGRTYPSIGQLCICAKSGKIFMGGHHPRSCLEAAQYECT